MDTLVIAPAKQIKIYHYTKQNFNGENKKYWIVKNFGEGSSYKAAT
jgi:hypothetical protein